MYQVKKRNWHNLEEFIQEFEQVYLNEKYLKIIHNNIKFCNQKKNHEIHSFITEMKQSIEKLEPLPNLEVHSPGDLMKSAMFSWSRLEN